MGGKGGGALVLQSIRTSGRRWSWTSRSSMAWAHRYIRRVSLRFPRKPTSR